MFTIDLTKPDLKLTNAQAKILGISDDKNEYNVKFVITDTLNIIGKAPNDYKQNYRSFDDGCQLVEHKEQKKYNFHCIKKYIVKYNQNKKVLQKYLTPICDIVMVLQSFELAYDYELHVKVIYTINRNELDI